MEYLVFYPDDVHGASSFTIIEADSEGEAKDIYESEIGIKDSIFRENVYQRVMNMSLSERFFQDEDGFLWDERTGEVRLPEEQVKRIFEENVRNFFSNDPEFAGYYLQFWRDDEKLSWKEAEEKWDFPESMLVMMFRAHFGEGLSVVPLGSIPRLEKEEA